ncbi:MAG: DUF1553 domain-containing protein [Planctomycetes bacterium]|nr:DUF1553 domain-containing protein [Planctomycetota bacterium]
MQLVVTDGAPPSGKVASEVLARRGDLTNQATFKSSDDKIVTVTPTGRLRARGNGKATITVQVAKREKSITVPVEVTDVLATGKVNFTTDISPLLSKAGCNAAACHASQHGKGGFKLSVFGYAPDEDYQAMVRDRQGRRANLNDPEQSLVLMKPTGHVVHGGGRRLQDSGIECEILRAWLAAGAPAPKADDPHVAKLTVYPDQRVCGTGVDQQLRVDATYSNGTTRDVTAMAKFDTPDESVAKVDRNGHFQTVGRGQAPVLVRYEGQAAVCMVVVPFSTDVKLAGWKNSNFVDELASAKFKQLGIEPSPLCDDSTFLRRAFLDAVGTLPSIDETKAFLASKEPKKREHLIDRLLGLTGDPKLDVHNNDYAAYWSVKWADLIRSSSDTLGEQGMWAMHNWILESMRANKPIDQFVRELITAQGSIYRNGPANYYRVATNPEDLAETTAQLFLGVRLTCAKCHHHPFEKYSQQDYYSFAAFFSRVGTKNSLEFGLFSREQVVMVKSAGEVRHPKTGKTLTPTPLEGEPVADASDRRVPLAAWLTSAENPFFARNIVNRYVANLLGHGLVEPVDDMRATNPATNPALLDALARDFTAHKFDVKHLMRVIMTSRLYQLDSQPTEANAADSKFFSHYTVKRLAAEPLLDAIDFVTGTQTKFKSLPLGTRAIELPDSNYPDYFLNTFGKPRRATVCECERVADENLSQALHTLNGDTLSAKINDSKGRLRVALNAKKPANEIIDELYLATLSRLPSENERKTCEKLLAESPSLQVFCEDLLWSLINSKHFLFVH